MSVTTAKTLESCPTLKKMGIPKADEISSYSHRGLGADKDVLKIRYKRAKGSLLRKSLTYRFGRPVKAVVADSGTSRMEKTYEISPVLLKAIAELSSLVDDHAR